MNTTFAPRYRLAWSILLVSFFGCLIISISIPLGITQLVQRATRPLLLQMLANQGTVGILSDTTGSRALFTGEPAQSVEAGGTIVTSGVDSGLMLIYPPDQSRILGRLQVYANTTLGIAEAATPRFATSQADSRLEIDLTSGRLQLTLNPNPSPSLIVTVHTTHGEVVLDRAGQYSVETSPANTQVSVQEGEALVQAMDQSLLLLPDQRARLTNGQPPEGPLDTERNLIRNADFNRGLDDWVLLEWNIELTDQPPGQTILVDRVGEPALTMIRDGIGHADTEVRQTISQDITDFSSLQLQVNMRVLFQSLGVCGQKGSECPLIVRLEFEDDAGISRSWQQGFFANGDFSPGTPDVCLLCPPPRSPHIRVPSGQVVFYESGNLIEEWRQQGVEVSRIKNISLVASGHAFEVEILDVALLAKQ